jgi:phenylpropionate dioxygenase-like ring-hydroxylating dioxygenase large terminal subunit
MLHTAGSKKKIRGKGKEQSMSYLRNCWYVAAWSSEVEKTIVSCVVLEEPIVLFRKANGEIAALEDRCAHRHVPLSRGHIVGDHIECGYHGLRYSETGACVHVPAQDSIPKRACVRAYAVVERYSWIWIWMGDRELANPDTIPDFHRLSDPAYAASGDTNDIEANYQLVNDNLLDLSHVGYVHGTTIGSDDFGAKGRVKAERTEKGVRVTRWVIDCAPPPSYCKMGAFKPEDRIDRWQIIDFEPPSCIDIHVGGALTGTGAPEGNRVGGLGMWVMNAMTPVSPTRTRYFWAVGRDFRSDNEMLTKIMHREVSTAFDQDKDILKSQQEAITRLHDPENVDIVADAGGIQARKA